RDPPPGCPPIGEAYASDGTITAHGGLPGEEGPKTHFEWPLTAARIDTWPNAGAFHDIGGHLERAFPLRSFALFTMGAKDRRKFEAASRRSRSVADAYDERVRFKRFDAFVGATGIASKWVPYNLDWVHSNA